MASDTRKAAPGRVTVRQMRAEDLPAAEHHWAVDLGFEMSHGLYERWFHSDPGGFWVAVACEEPNSSESSSSGGAGRIVGTASAVRQTESWYFVGTVGVAKEFRGQGVGRRLLDAVHSRLSVDAGGCKGGGGGGGDGDGGVTTSESVDTNAAFALPAAANYALSAVPSALPIYERMGYTKVGHTTAYIYSGRATLPDDMNDLYAWFRRALLLNNSANARLEADTEVGGDKSQEPQRQQREEQLSRRQQLDQVEESSRSGSGSIDDDLVIVRVTSPANRKNGTAGCEIVADNRDEDAHSDVSNGGELDGDAWLSERVQRRLRKLIADYDADVHGFHRNLNQTLLADASDSGSSLVLAAFRRPTTVQNEARRNGANTTASVARRSALLVRGSEPSDADDDVAHAGAVERLVGFGKVSLGVPTAGAWVGPLYADDTATGGRLLAALLARFEAAARKSVFAVVDERARAFGEAMQLPLIEVSPRCHWIRNPRAKLPPLKLDKLVVFDALDFALI